MITLDIPESREDATTARLVSFTANAVLKYAEAQYEIGFVDASGFSVTRRHTIRFSNTDETADFTFTQLVQAVPEVRNLASAMEQQAIDREVFDGVVD
jgi:hypothetical protein